MKMLRLNKEDVMLFSELGEAGAYVEQRGKDFFVVAESKLTVYQLSEKLAARLLETGAITMEVE